jgi:hypothetical protein
LDQQSSFLLDNGRAITNGPAAYEIAYAQLHQIAAAQFTVDGEVEQGSGAQSLVLIEIETDGPDVSRAQRPFPANMLASIPRAPLMHGGVKI